MDSLYQGNPSSEAEGIKARQQNVNDYVNTYGPAIAKPAPAPAKAAPAPAPVDKVNPKAKYGDRPGEKRIDTSDMTKPLGSFKKGGKIKKTGIYKLHKNERVLNAKQTKKAEAGKSPLMKSLSGSPND